MSTRITVLLLTTLVLATAAVVALGAAGRLPVYDPQPGRPLAIREEIPGPPTGPPCPVDNRYVDEQPDGLHPDVLAAWHRLTATAATQDIRLCLNDGKRSRAQQRAEFEEAVRKFGTEDLAAKYVLPPEKSEHVRGRAVDIQPHSAAQWVERNATSLGWCRRYDNEYWHFEYDPTYVTAGCPPLLPSATGT
ncbi:D-alanyl-D-alanine carboxypeptidase family protein [Saccharothrix sp.]|uniref:D-alanyl-D-alanine carboxypeptidase family protein n=1 Tax=Saccharothrix sp. TaxID=1873460 RepID=UPI002811C170|nr:D-alanyl-D-alanine carboxypeptidase family protein [Saccharothrix sp.]